MTQVLSEDDLNADERELVAAAQAAASHAYCRYSGYAVGAALRAEDGRVFSGCNVENGSYGATICAERAAICAMIAAGSRRIQALCVFAPAEPMAMPCGMCRQVISEFCADAPLLVAGPRGVLRRSFGQLFPEAFRLSAEEPP